MNDQRAAQILKHVMDIVQLKEPESFKLHKLWYDLAYIKAFDLAKLLTAKIGPQVFSGPFKGMQLTPAAMTGAYAPALLGTYETELHDEIEKFIAHPYRQILNIGCAYGYYAVGFALRMPQVIVHAFDIDEKEQQRCRDMIATNKVQDRVTVFGLFEGEKFADYAGKQTLLLMDIEGGEMNLLDPQKYPALRNMDVLVELHDVLDSQISKTITERFAPTHDITMIRNHTTLFDLEPILGPQGADPFDSLLANWEARDGETPWAVMRRK